VSITILARNLTYEEWRIMPEVEDGTDEVVRGELRFMPPYLHPHAEIIRRVNRSLSGQIDEKEVGILGSNFGLMISREPLTCRCPDFVMFRRGEMRIEDGWYWSAPALIVEVLSPFEDRLEERLDDYAALGTPEVWVISPEARTVEVRRLQGGRLERTAVLTEGSLQPSQFAEVAVSVPNLFPKSIL
jgi:Uma2 family endonuclease